MMGRSKKLFSFISISSLVSGRELGFGRELQETLPRQYSRDLLIQRFSDNDDWREERCKAWFVRF